MRSGCSGHMKSARLDGTRRHERELKRKRGVGHKKRASLRIEKRLSKPLLPECSTHAAADFVDDARAGKGLADHAIRGGRAAPRGRILGRIRRGVKEGPVLITAGPKTTERCRRVAARKSPDPPTRTVSAETMFRGGCYHGLSFAGSLAKSFQVTRPGPLKKARSLEQPVSFEC